MTGPGQGKTTAGSARRTEALVWLLVVIGVGLRVWQMAGGASLWLDELDVARNVAQRTYGGLFRPLDYGQVAPPVLLVIMKAGWSALGGADWTLRILPFAGALASVFLFRNLSRRFLQGGALVLAMALFAVCVPMIQEGAQVKQYSTDLAIALALSLLALRAVPNDATQGRLVAAGLAGFAAVWVSNTAVFMVTGLGAALAWLTASWRPGPGRRVLLLVVLPWAAGAGAATLLSLHAMSLETHGFMQAYWSDAFAPLPPHTLKDLAWPWYTLKEPFRVLLGYRFSSAFVPLMLLGFAVLWRAHRGSATLLLAPLAVTAAAALARQYPFADRLVLFLAPVFFIGVAAGAGWIGSAAAQLNPLVGTAVVVLVSGPALERIVVEHPVYRLEESEPLYAWLGRQWRPGDALFMSLGAVPGFEWYGPRFGLRTADTAIGGCWPEDPGRYMRHLDVLRGRERAWILMVRVNSAQLDSTWRYADTIAVRRDEFVSAPPQRQAAPLRVRLYDFSDSTRLARASADAFAPRLARAYPVGVMGCYLGPVSARRRDAEGRPFANDRPGTALPQ